MPAPKGNQNAKKGRKWREALNDALHDDPEALFRIAKKVVALAEEGDIQSIKEIGDRLDGKPTQRVAGDEDEAPLFPSVIELVKPKG